MRRWMPPPSRKVPQPSQAHLRLPPGLRAPGFLVQEGGMNTPIAPWINVTLHQTQRFHHLAWFLYGWIEREQLLNLEALVAWRFRGV
jgi:hypothetical protein